VQRGSEQLTLKNEKPGNVFSRRFLAKCEISFDCHISFAFSPPEVFRPALECKGPLCTIRAPARHPRMDAVPVLDEVSIDWIWCYFASLIKRMIARLPFHVARCACGRVCVFLMQLRCLTGSILRSFLTFHVSRGFFPVQNC
jgi:hypothetical protein